MMIEDVMTKIKNGDLRSIFAELYGPEEEVLSYQSDRYLRALSEFSRTFPETASSGKETFLFSAPGRTEICGNHTDHQHGRVLAAAVDLDAIAVVSGNDTHLIRLQSEGYKEVEVDLSDTSPKEEEKGTTASLIRGVAAQFISRGVDVKGFDAYVTSDVLSGSGLSSSAAFEVLTGNIIDHMSNGGKAGSIEIAKYGQIAENNYFGKASGLMDQMVSSVGGFVGIDFADPRSPKIDTHQCDLNKLDFSLIITDTKGSHADLSGEYSAIPKEMQSVASFFGKEYLREVDEKAFYANLAEMKKTPGISDRAILRSAHFFSDDARVPEEEKALDEGDMRRFLDLVNASGNSSAALLQNLYCAERPADQEIPLALLLSRRVLGDQGACRVHGGGFAGTIQAFVPKAKVKEYIGTLEGVFGNGSCHILRIRPRGGIRVL